MSVLNQSGEEQVECPLCMEPLEVDDLHFYPCTCGYQICRFCWNRIREGENGLCPACRKAYPENPADFTPLSQEQVAAIKTEKKAREQKKRNKTLESRKALANVRVVQNNLVFVVGLPVRLADPEILKKPDYFGKYGKIQKVVINQSTTYAGSQGPSASAYVTYERSCDALRAIQSVNNVTIDGRVLKGSLGTTKYCANFMKNQPCPKSDCMYLHELGDSKASFTKEEMHQGLHQIYERKLHNALLMQPNNDNNIKQTDNNGKGHSRDNSIGTGNGSTTNHNNNISNSNSVDSSSSNSNNVSPTTITNGNNQEQQRKKDTEAVLSNGAILTNGITIHNNKCKKESVSSISSQNSSQHNNTKEAWPSLGSTPPSRDSTTNENSLSEGSISPNQQTKKNSDTFSSLYTTGQSDNSTASDVNNSDMERQLLSMVDESNVAFKGHEFGLKSFGLLDNTSELLGTNYHKSLLHQQYPTSSSSVQHQNNIVQRESEARYGENTMDKFFNDFHRNLQMKHMNGMTNEDILPQPPAEMQPLALIESQHLQRKYGADYALHRHRQDHHQNNLSSLIQHHPTQHNTVFGAPPLSNNMMGPTLQQLNTSSNTQQMLRNNDDDLDFDPFKETQKALAEMMQNEMLTNGHISDRTVHNRPPPGFTHTHMNSFGLGVPRHPQQDWTQIDPAIMSTSVNFPQKAVLIQQQMQRQQQHELFQRFNQINTQQHINKQLPPLLHQQQNQRLTGLPHLTTNGYNMHQTKVEWSLPQYGHQMMDNKQYANIPMPPGFANIGKSATGTLSAECIESK